MSIDDSVTKELINQFKCVRIKVHEFWSLHLFSSSQQYEFLFPSLTTLLCFSSNLNWEKYSRVNHSPVKYPRGVWKLLLSPHPFDLLWLDTCSLSSWMIPPQSSHLNSFTSPRSMYLCYLVVSVLALEAVIVTTSEGIDT